MPSKNLELFLIGRDLSASKALKNLSKEAEKTSAIGGKIGGAFKVGSLAAAGAVAALAVESIHLASAYEAADTRLRVAVTNTGNSFKALQPEVHDLDEKMVHLGFTGTETESALSGLVSATKNPTESIKLMGLAADIARGRNIDLATATSILTKVETGHVALLGRIGINTKDATGKTISATEAVKRLSDMYGGQAQAHAQTFSGRLEVVKAQGEELAVKFGMALIPAVEKAGEVLLTAAHDAEAAAHFIQQHKVAVEALAAVIGVSLIPKLALLGAQYATLGLAKIGMLFEGLTTGTGRLATALGTLISPTGLAAAGIGGLTYEVLMLRGESQRAHAAVKSMAKDFDNLNPTTAKSVEAIQSMDAAYQQATDTLNGYGSRWKQVTVGVLQILTPFTKNSVYNAEQTQEAVVAQDAAIAEASRNTGLAISQAIKDMTPPKAATQSLVDYDNKMNDLGDTVRTLADQMNLGPALAAGGQQADDAIKQIEAAYKNLAVQAHVPMSTLEMLAGNNVKKMEALKDAVIKAGDATSKAFVGATNVVDNFTGDTSLSKYFTTTVANANKFADNIQIATKRGLDPALVQQLLEAGPEKAAPILNQLVKDHSGRMISLANTSETALAKINSEVVRMSQLTTLAINAPKQAAERMAEELPAALKIAQLQMAHHSMTVAQVADALGISKAKAQAIGADFGITFSSTVAKNVHTTITATTHGSGSTQSVSIQGGGTMGRRAAGGPVLPYRDYIVGENRPEILRMGASGGYVYPSTSSGARSGDRMTTREGQEIIRLLAEVNRNLAQQNKLQARTPAAVGEVLNGLARR